MKLVSKVSEIYCIADDFCKNEGMYRDYLYRFDAYPRV